MTDLAERPAAATRLGIEEVADSFVVLMQTFVKARNQMLATADTEVEWSAHMILRALRAEGPIRAGALAEVVRSDPSTVSRQVATLVKHGLLERRADPEDGRAALLVLTDLARRVLAEQDKVRLEHYAASLDTWTDDELGQFAALLRRFTDDYDHANNRRMSERDARGAARSGGRN